MKEAIFLVLICVLKSFEGNEIDQNGYVMYCPCMGRFGNQAEQFLGALAFSQGLNRTLVLPPWITYPADKPFQSLQIPFDKWFQVESLREFHRVITMEKFMKTLSHVWPEGKRKGFCYAFRNGESCSMKEGNPFGPFWNNFDVNFDSYTEHSGLLWDSDVESMKTKWLTRFPASKFPVLAFQGAPGHFPSLQRHQYLQKFIYFSSYLTKEADRFIKNEIGGKRYIAIHLRNGIDLVQVCDQMTSEDYTSFFASVQCTGYNKAHKLTYSMCNPSNKEIIKQVKKYIKKTKVEALYIATDNNPLVELFHKELKRMKVSMHTRTGLNQVDDPLIDIALLSKANYFIGNCVSTFSAFVRRQRESRNEPVAFFGIDYPAVKDEL